MYNIFTKRKIWVVVLSVDVDVDGRDPAVETNRELFYTRSGAWDYVLAWNETYRNVCSFAVIDCEYIPRANGLHTYTKEIA